ncbi:MAG: MerR family transcriptional regulator [Desulfocucumaceae bacterium]
MYNIAHLVKKSGLARSTLLYYDSIGLLKASGRTESNYRRYSDEDIKRLEQICIYRRAGLSIEDITKILDSPENTTVAILEGQLRRLNEEILKLRVQQNAIVKMLKNDRLIFRTGIINKETWTALLHSMGFDRLATWKWHVQFEKDFPEEHQLFLESLGLSTEEVRQIRERSKEGLHEL